MTERDPFRVMCDMWGTERAIEKAREFGVSISQEVLDEQERKKKAFYAIWKSIIEARKVSRDGKTD